MASFSKLPNEIIEMILRLVLPEDVESVAVISKHVHSLSTSIVEEHKRLRNKYHEVCNHIVKYDDPRHPDGITECPAGILPSLLKFVLDRPYLGHYIRIIHVAWWFESFDPVPVNEPAPLLENHLSYPDSQMAAFKAAIPSAPVPGADLHDWAECLDSGGEDSVTALLLLKAPYLERIIIENLEPNPWCVLKAARIAAFQAPRNEYLSRLTHVYMSSYGWDPLPWLRAFMSLPSVTSISVVGVFEENTDETDDLFPLQPRSSNVSELCLSGTFYSQNALSELLQSCKCLTTFEYYMEASNLYDENLMFDCHAVITTLQAYSKDTVKSLDVVIDPFRRDIITDPPIPNFGSFTCLENLELDATTLTKSDGTATTATSDFLPSSLRTLTLKCEHIDEDKFVNRVISFGHYDLARLEKLEKVEFQTSSDNRAATFAQAVDAVELEPQVNYVIGGTTVDYVVKPENAISESS